DVGRELLPEGVRLWTVALAVARAIFEEVARRIEAEAVDAAPQPERRDPLHLLAYRRRAEIEIRHPRGEEAVVIGAAPRRMPGPGPGQRAGAPDVPVPLR